MQLLSVNVSGIKTVDDNGKPVTTGIFKEPVAGPVALDKLNLAGDDQADRRFHGGEHKAIYAFGQQHLAYWQAELNRSDLGPGFFGENLSIDHLDEHALRIGDYINIAECRFQITQPRVPCFKQGIRAASPKFPRQFMMRGLTGVYLRVITPGSISAGDEITHEANPTSSFSTADLFKAVHDKDAEVSWRTEVIKDALDNPALSGEWRDLVSKKTDALN